MGKFAGLGVRGDGAFDLPEKLMRPLWTAGPSQCKLGRA